MSSIDFKSENLAYAQIILLPREPGIFDLSTRGPRLKDMILSACREKGIDVLSGRLTERFIELKLAFPKYVSLYDLLSFLRAESSDRLILAWPELADILNGQSFWADDYYATLTNDSSRLLADGDDAVSHFLSALGLQAPMAEKAKVRRRILVTGGAGFIGSTLVDHLISRDYEVAVVDDLSSGQESYLNPRARFYRLDIRDRESILRAFSEFRPDYVAHLAAQIDVRLSVENPVYDIDVNVLGSINVLEAARENSVKKLVFANTGGALYGGATVMPTPESYPTYPLSPYGINKLVFEKYLHFYYSLYRLPYVSLRMANVYGPRQFKGGEAGVAAIFTERAINEGKVTIFGDGLQTRDFVYVDDVAEAFVRALESDFVGELNIGTGQETSILQLAEMIGYSLGRPLQIDYQPAKSGEERRSALDARAATEAINWRPQMQLAEGLRHTYAWTLEKILREKNNHK